MPASRSPYPATCKSPLGNRGTSSYRLHSSTLDVTDLLQVEVDVFGLRSAGDLRQSYAAEGLSGTVRYAGGLLGAAIDRTGLPPVTGDSSLAVNLGSLDGTASFTSLQVHTRGTPGTFSGGSLHYPFELSANGISGTGTGSTLRADFYGPGHESVAGALHDPGAGLLASFGAAHDDRPGREDVVASADRRAGRGRTGPARRIQRPTDGPSTGARRLRPASRVAPSRTAREPDWTIGNPLRGACRDGRLDVADGRETRSGPRLRAHRPAFGMLPRTASGAVMSWTATRERSSTSRSGPVSRRHTDWSLLSRDGIAETDSSFSKWSGASRERRREPRPTRSARWSGLMLGYQSGRILQSETPFVEGLASLEYSLGRQQPGRGVLGRREPGRAAGPSRLRLQGPGRRGRWNVRHRRRSRAPWTAPSSAPHPRRRRPARSTTIHRDVTGSFGARRLPGVAALEESDPSKTRTPIVDVDETRYVGADAAPALDRARGRRRLRRCRGVIGRSAATARARSRVLAYLERHIDED